MKKPSAPSGYLFLFLIILILYGLVGIFPKVPSESSLEEGNTFVEVAGDVRWPGVYASDALPRLDALVERAGGIRGKGRLPVKDQGAGLVSGARVDVLERGYSIGEMSAFYKVTLGIPLSLNYETETGLTALPGLGPGLAQAIIQERAKRGGFERLEDLSAVKGIGPRLFHRIAPLLRL